MKYIFYTRKPNLENRIIRISVPRGIKEKIKGKFIEVAINSNRKFLYKLDEDRLVISKENLSKINFKEKNKIEFLPIQKIERKRYFKIKEGKIDILGLIPLKTSSNSNIEVIEKSNNKLLCIAKNFNGRVREIEIQRFVPLEFCRLLGYYQAEGGKRIQDVVLTNTDLSLILDFLKLSKELINIPLWSAEIKLLKRNKNKEEKLSKKLVNQGIIPEKIKIRTEKKIKDFSIRLSISSKLLSEIILNLMNEIREELIELDISKIPNKNIYSNFIQGLFAGDGHYATYKNKEGGRHHRLIFYERDEPYAIDYQKLLEKVGIKNKIIKEKNKNMCIVRATLNWYFLLKIFDLKLFNFHEKHMMTLKNSIISHKRYKSFKYLCQLDNKFSIQDVEKILKKKRVICYNWIKKMMNYGPIEKNKINNWSLTKEGKKVRDIIINLNK